MHDPERLIELAHEMEQPRADYLTLKAVVERFEAGKNSVLGECMADIRGTDWKGSAEAMRLHAHHSEKFRKFLAGLARARDELTKAEIQFRNAESMFSAYQSALSFEREAVKKGIY